MHYQSLPLITIVTVVFNAVDTLEETVKSVANQTYNNIQYIIIDGGSTDGSLDVIERYRRYVDVLVSEKDEGIYDAMNKALSYGKGDWIYFLGADDLLLTPTLISELVTLFVDKTKIYYGDTYLKNSNRMYCGKIDKAKLALGNISHQAIFYPRRIYSNKHYNLRYKYFADHVYNLELYAQEPDKFEYLPKLISVYNDLGRSSTIKDVNYASDIIGIMRKNFGLRLASYVWFRRKVSRLKNKLTNKKTVH